MRTKGIGPQGLGLKGNNGYEIGSPARDKAAKKFDKATRYDDMLGRATNPNR